MKKSRLPNDPQSILFSRKRLWPKVTAERTKIGLVITNFAIVGLFLLFTAILRSHL
jgi:hypothetical protein